MAKNIRPAATQDQDEGESPQPLFKNVVFWTAMIGGIGAISAAFVNAYVAYVNNNTLLDMETRKEIEEQYIEPKKAEYMRLLEISKLDVEAAQKKLNAFCEMSIITDQVVCQAGFVYQKNHTTSQSNPPAQDTGTVSQTFWDSSWVGGGHNQQDVCNSAIPELNARPDNAGKTITFMNASEDSRKDFFGHVTYRYHCIYRVFTP